MAGRNGWWCCCSGCWVFEDNFNRDQSTDIGGNWNEVEGDWGIIGSEIEGELIERYPYES